MARPPDDPRRQPAGARRRLTAGPGRPGPRPFTSTLATAECVIRGHERGAEGGLGQTGGMGSIRRLLVANRGEVALRILRAAAELDIETVAVHAEDDGGSLAVRRADRAVPLRGTGPAAYLDAEQLVAVAVEQGCDAVHPGYGFLAEQAAFAERCRDAGLVFVGPEPETLAVLGDKVAARAVAGRCGLAVLAGTEGPTTPDEAHAFLASLGEGAAVMVKAVAGGGGGGCGRSRGPRTSMRRWRVCAVEAAAAFGDGALYLERLVPRARHVEVQIVGDGSGAVVHLHTRECSLQRRRQKLVEIAPAPHLPDELRDEMTAAAVRLGEAVRYERRHGRAAGRPRRRAACRAAGLHRGQRPPPGRAHGDGAGDRGRPRAGPAAAGRWRHPGRARPRQAAIGPPRGVAVQARVNAERLRRRHRGTGHRHDHGLRPPGGPGVRVDGGPTPGGRQPPLRLAAGQGDRQRAHRRSGRGPAADGRALGELRVDGVPPTPACSRPAGAPRRGGGRGDDEVRRRPPRRAPAAVARSPRRGPTTAPSDVAPPPAAPLDPVSPAPGSTPTTRSPCSTTARRRPTRRRRRRPSDRRRRAGRVLSPGPGAWPRTAPSPWPPRSRARWSPSTWPAATWSTPASRSSSWRP